MKYEIYIDAFFLLNFFIDTLLLFLVRKVLGCTATRLRLLFGGAFGAGMACVITITPFVPVWIKLFTGYGIVSICMIRISFRRLHTKAVLKATVCLYVFAFLVGGALQMLSVQIPFFRKYGMGMIAVCAAGMTVYIIAASLYDSRKKKSCLLPVKLIWQKREMTVQALVDTGNSLYEPIGRKPVSVVEKNILEALFDGEYPDKFRAVPFRSIGRGHGILKGYEITEMIIEGENEKIKIEEPIVGLFDGKLSADKAYQMILHPTLTKNQEESI